MSNYLQLCQKIIRDLGMSISISTVADQTGTQKKIVDWVADADEFVQALYTDWNFLWSQHSVSTIATIREYAKPSDLGTWDLDSFYLDYTSDNYVKLTKIDYRVWRSAYRQGTQTNNKPASFVITPAKNIYLEPIPDDAYTLTADYWKVPTRMTENTSTSDIPTKFERIILARAKVYYAEHEEFPNVYELATKEYDDLLKQLEADELPGREEYGRGHASDSDMVIRVE